MVRKLLAGCLLLGVTLCLITLKVVSQDNQPPPVARAREPGKVRADIVKTEKEEDERRADRDPPYPRGFNPFAPDQPITLDGMMQALDTLEAQKAERQRNFKEEMAEFQRQEKVLAERILMMIQQQRKNFGEQRRNIEEQLKQLDKLEEQFRQQTGNSPIGEEKGRKLEAPCPQDRPNP
jgi:hypothetical protein